MEENLVTELRSEFAKFESSLTDAGALDALKDAIAIYHEIIADLSISAHGRVVARNVLNAYARIFLSEANNLANDPRRADHKFNDYWANMEMQFVELHTEYEDEIRERLVEFLVMWSKLVPMK